MTVITSTGTVTVNAAFLQEIKEVNQELWSLLADLRHRCQRPIAPGHCRQLDRQALPASRSVGPALFAGRGLRLFRRSGRCRPAARPAGRAACGTSTRSCTLTCATWSSGPSGCSTTSSTPPWPSGSARSSWNSTQRLRSHEERENELIFDAYDGDIGVGD